MYRNVILNVMLSTGWKSGIVSLQWGFRRPVVVCVGKFAVTLAILASYVVKLFSHMLDPIVAMVVL